VSKKDAIVVYVSDDEEITAAVYPSTSVSVSSVESGEHLITTSLSGGTLSLQIDSDTPETTALVGGVPDTSDDWEFNLNDAMPYMDYLKITTAIGGSSEKLWYQPTAMISGTTLPDRDTGDGTDNGVITWGSNSDLTVTIGDMTPYESTSYGGGTGGGDIKTIPPVSQPDAWYGEATTIEGLPFYTTFYDAADSMGMPVKTLYQIIMLGTASAVGLGVLVFTGSAFIAAMVMAITIAAGVSAGGGVLGGWMVYSALILSVGILFLVKQH
jgi:hypothetical protein